MVLAKSALAWDVSETLRFVRLLVAAVSAVWPQARVVSPSPVPLGPDRVE